jgi:hypothetical protein
MARQGSWPTPTCRDSFSIKKVTRGAASGPGGTPLVLAVLGKDGHGQPVERVNALARRGPGQAPGGEETQPMMFSCDCGHTGPMQALDFPCQGCGRIQAGSVTYPTPQAAEAKQSANLARREERRMQLAKKGKQLQISLTEAAARVTWPTPRNNTGPSVDKKHLSLDGAVQIWPTPQAAPESAASHGQFSGDFRRGLEERGVSPAGQLSPTWTEWIMGWPLNWTSMEPLPWAVWTAWLRAFHGVCPGSEQ